MYALQVKIRFRAGHRLIEPYSGKCNNPHGEAFTAIFSLQERELDECGMLIDFGVVKKRLKEHIDFIFDHAYICHKDDEVGQYLASKGFKVVSLPANPTAENLAKQLFLECEHLCKPAQLVKVGIVESFEDSIAFYSEPFVVSRTAQKDEVHD